MKLIYCPECKSISSLSRVLKFCDCKHSGGWYRDNLNAEIWGNAIPLGINNTSFLSALQHRPKEGLGKAFTAFVIPKKCATVRETNDRHIQPSKV